MELQLNTLADIHQVAQQIIAFSDQQKIWVFEGSMGAGKTTLIRAIAKHFNIVDETSSPTFSLVNVYSDESDNEYYHFDFYRIEKEIEAVDIGCDEYFYSGQYCFIEWAERIPSLVPPKHIKICIKLGSDNGRIITLSKHD